MYLKPILSVFASLLLCFSAQAGGGLFSEGAKRLQKQKRSYEKRVESVQKFSQGDDEWDRLIISDIELDTLHDLEASYEVILHFFLQNKRVSAKTKKRLFSYANKKQKKRLKKAIAELNKLKLEGRPDRELIEGEWLEQKAANLAKTDLNEFKRSLSKPFLASK